MAPLIFNPAHFDILRRHFVYSDRSKSFYIWPDMDASFTCYYQCGVDGQQNLMTLSAEDVPDAYLRERIFASFRASDSINLNELACAFVAHDIIADSIRNCIEHKLSRAQLEREGSELEKKLIKGLTLLDHCKVEDFKFLRCGGMMDIFHSLIKLSDENRESVMQRWKTLPGLERFSFSLTPEQHAIKLSLRPIQGQDNVINTAFQLMRYSNKDKQFMLSMWIKRSDGDHDLFLYTLTPDGQDQAYFFESVTEENIDLAKSTIGIGKDQDVEKYVKDCHVAQQVLSARKSPAEARRDIETCGSIKQEIEKTVKEIMGMKRFLNKATPLNRDEISVCVEIYAAKANRPEFMAISQFLGLRTEVKAEAAKNVIKAWQETISEKTWGVNPLPSRTVEIAHHNQRRR